MKCDTCNRPSMHQHCEACTKRQQLYWASWEFGGVLAVHVGDYRTIGCYEHDDDVWLSALDRGDGEKTVWLEDEAEATLRSYAPDVDVAKVKSVARAFLARDAAKRVGL